MPSARAVSTSKRPGRSSSTERVSERLDPVLDGEARDQEAGEADLLLVLELDHLERVAGAADHGVQHLVVERDQAGWPFDLQRLSGARMSNVSMIPGSPSQ